MSIVRAAVAAALCSAALAPTASAASLPTVPSGARPGPDLLYADAPPAPQLSNAGPWTAPPILVSGATAYREGEFLYQDFLYDDHEHHHHDDRQTPQPHALPLLRHQNPVQYRAGDPLTRRVQRSRPVGEVRS